MTKTEIAKIIIDICHKDASFCKDIKGGDPKCFLSQITDDINEKDFLFAVDKYLATFKVWGHLYFYKKKQCPQIGFHVRRYGKSLFITYAEKDLPFSKGDEIIAIDGLLIKEAAEKFACFFGGDPPDRQGERWEIVIKNSESLTVKQNKKIFEYAVKTDMKSANTEYAYTCKRLNEDCFYIKLIHFFEHSMIDTLIEEYGNEIESTKNLIVDVRNNCGGNDIEFLPLLKYFLEKDDNMCGKPIFTSEDEILYTERNVNGRINYYNEYLKSASEEGRKYLNNQIAEQIKNKGKGFMPAKSDEFLFPMRGTINPQKVVVLTDYYCASSAESLVEIASRLNKVTVIGRPTMGICDYSNLTRMEFGEYVLHYPTSRSKAIDKGKGTREKGLTPDIYVPWTPKHISEDVDLAVALDWLAKK